jgi:hypothetical protein
VPSARAFAKRLQQVIHVPRRSCVNGAVGRHRRNTAKHLTTAQEPRVSSSPPISTTRLSKPTPISLRSRPPASFSPTSSPRPHPSSLRASLTRALPRVRQQPPLKMSQIHSLSDDQVCGISMPTIYARKSLLACRLEPNNPRPSKPPPPHSSKTPPHVYTGIQLTMPPPSRRSDKSSAR